MRNIIFLLLTTGLIFGVGHFHHFKAQFLIIPDSKSSDGSMYGGNLQRTRVYNSKGLSQPKSQLWQTEKLFTLQESMFFSGRNGSLSYYGWLPTSQEVSHPILIDGMIYFSFSSSENSYLYALDANSGKEKKTLKIKKVNLSVPAIVGDVIYLGGSNGSFLAINRKTGEPVWQIEKKGFEFNLVAPVVADNTLYFGGAQFGIDRSIRPDGTVHALALDTGQQKWMLKVKGIPTSAAISEDTIVFGDMDNQLFALDRNTGREKWKFKAAANVKSPAIIGESIYCLDDNGSIYRIDLKTGQQHWKLNKVKAYGALALNDGLVFFKGVNSIYAIDALTGADKWKFNTSETCNSPMVADGVIYFACSDETIYAVAAATGQEKWRYKSKGEILMSPLVGDGVLYFLDNKGYMYAVN